MTIIIRQWINFIGNSHHFHEYRWIIFHFTFIIHIYTVVFIILLNTSDNLFYVCVVNICCEYTCKIYVQCFCVKIMLLKSSHVECVPKSASALWIIVPFCCWQSLATRQQGLLNGQCLGAVDFVVVVVVECCMCLLVLYVVGHRDYIIPPVRKDSLVADPTTSPRSPYILPPPPPETRMKVQVLTHNGSISSDTE